MSTTVHKPAALRTGLVSWQWNLRLACWLVLTAVATVLFMALGITLGDYPLTLTEVLTVFAGGGTAIEQKVVLDLRLGRAVVGAAVGACLAFSGALTQTVARNPLASPDILGITNGASLAAVAALILGGAGAGGTLSVGAEAMVSSLGVPGTAVVGALLIAALIWFIAGPVRGDMMSLVLIGVGCSILLSALTTWLLAWAELDRAAEARMWLTGSLNGRDLNHAWAPLVVSLLAIAAAGWLAFQLAALSLGEATAHVLGHNVRITQMIQLLTAVILAAVAVSAAGPIGFIAFVTPQIARRLAGTATPPLVLSAFCGAALLTGADLFTRTVVPWELPVGVVTAFFGAPVLLYLIISNNRKVR
ncbi:FecCD family ABC transporter permease [Corynebacterium hylobatis]|nr:iron ABC transporter permease [Corynebacterium hylobatis]